MNEKIEAGPSEGWGFPGNGKRWHYFINGRSLCGKWAFFGPLEADDGEARSVDCRACSKRFSASRAKSSGSAP